MKINTKTMRTRSVAVLAGIAVTGAVSASAATLGGLGEEELGADTADVLSCDTDGVEVSYTTSFEPASGRYEVDSVTIGGVDPTCNGQNFSMTLTDGTNVLGVVEEGVVAVTAASDSFDVALADGVSAESVTDVALVISGVTI